jgi:ribose transport system substrate-binding protein
MRSWIRVVCLIGLIAVVLAGCGGSTEKPSTSSTSSSSSTKSSAPGERAAEPSAMTGPNGEASAPASAVDLSAADIAKIKAGNFTVAFVWHTTDTFTHGVEIAARERFKELGIKVVADTVANFDPAKQEADLQTVLALKPDVIVTLPVDAASSAAMYRSARKAGAKLIFISNIPAGFKHGSDYVGVVTNDVIGAAVESARLLGEKLGGKGKIGLLYFDAKFFIVNQWDKAFEETIKQQFPDIQIVAKMGFADPAKANEPASAMLARYPDLNGIYVSWQDPAVGVLTALRAAGRKDVAVTDNGMNETTALDMVKGGNFIGGGTDSPLEMGKVLANEVGYAALGKPAPAFIATGYNVVTKDNVIARWPKIWGVPAPKAVVDAAGQ